jgi:transposase
MSTSLLYHGFGLRGYHFVRHRFHDGAIHIDIEHAPRSLCCGRCGSTNVWKAGTVPRQFKTLPIGPRPVFLELPVQRLWCFECGATRQAKLGFAGERVGYTRAFERYALSLLRFATIKDVSLHLGAGWDTIKDIQKRNLGRRFGRPGLKQLKRLAIDEISIGHGHRYLTIVLDLDSGAVVFVGEGKGADSLGRFWRRLRASGAKIEAVASDLSPAYGLAIRQNLPKAVHVYDRFHVVKLFNDKLSELRRAMHREAEGPLQKKVLKGTRWLLLKNPENLDETKNDRRRLEEALALNRPLATAYYLKEDLRQFWEQTSRRQAERCLDDWIARASSSGVRMLQQFAQTLQSHRHGLLNYYDYPITTAALEGTNNKIKTLQRQAYGFRDREFFKLRIYALHESRYALVG